MGPAKPTPRIAPAVWLWLVVTLIAVLFLIGVLMFARKDRTTQPVVTSKEYFEEGRRAGYAQGVNDALDQMAFQDPIRGKTIARKLGVERK